jgi:prephenate dehydratase
LHHPSVTFDAVDTLISHPQALAQCKDTLAAQYPDLALISGEGDLIDQAYCAQRIAEGAIAPTTAVLASQICSTLYDLATYRVGLQDLGADNLTTFVWVKRRHYFR